MAEGKKRAGDKGVDEIPLHFRKAYMVSDSTVALPPSPPLPPAATAAAPARRSAVKRGLLSKVMVCEIFFRLPARSLARIRPACKMFEAIISDPLVIHSYAAARATATPGGVFSTTSFYCTVPSVLFFVRAQEDEGEASRVSTSQLRDLGSPAIHDDWTEMLLRVSCDGMLGFLGSRSSTILVCNPFIRGDWIIIPNYRQKWWHIRLAGFYFHEPTGQYRLIQSVFSQTRKIAKYEVLALGSTVWRTIGKAVRCAEPIEHDSWIPAHGRLFFLPVDLDDADDAPIKDDVVHFFDIETEEFGRIGSPVTAKTHKYCSLVILREGLGLCAPWSGEVIKVFLLQDHRKEVWVNLYTINLQGIQYPPTFSKDDLDNLTFWTVLRDQRLLFLWVIHETLTHGLVSYHPKCNAVRNINLEGAFFSQGPERWMHKSLPYVETPINCKLFEKRAQTSESKKRARNCYMLQFVVLLGLFHDCTTVVVVPAWCLWRTIANS